MLIRHGALDQSRCDFNCRILMALLPKLIQDYMDVIMKKTPHFCLSIRQCARLRRSSDAGMASAKWSRFHPLNSPDLNALDYNI